MNLGESILMVEAAYKVYGDGTNEVCALNGVTVQHRPGEMLAVFGPSGSGKTTFLMIAGLIDVPSRGRVLYRGHEIASPSTDLDHLRKFRQKHIGFVFQRSNLLPFLTAMENVQIAMQLCGMPAEKSTDRAWLLLRRLRIDHRAHALPHQLSGGEQQRVAIARALANRPTLIFADEPTGALDSMHGRQVMTLFRELADTESVAVCVVTHDPRSVDLFDRIIEFSDGTIVKQYRAQDRSGKGAPFDRDSLFGPGFNPNNWRVEGLRDRQIDR